MWMRSSSAARLEAGMDALNDRLTVSPIPTVLPSEGDRSVSSRCCAVRVPNDAWVVTVFPSPPSAFACRM